MINPDQHVNQIINGLRGLQEDIMELNTKMGILENIVYDDQNQNYKFFNELTDLINRRKDNRL
jgi:hypothetical protein